MAATKKRKTGGYTGALARPFPPLPPKDDPRYAVELAARQKEMERRAQLLAAHHGVTDGDPYSMLTALIHAHVPGFQRAKKAGRKRRWLPHHFEMVRETIDHELSMTSLPVTKIAANLATQEPWRSFRATAEVIRRMYYVAGGVRSTGPAVPEAVKKLAAAISSRE